MERITHQPEDVPYRGFWPRPAVLSYGSPMTEELGAPNKWECLTVQSEALRDSVSLRLCGPATQRFALDDMINVIDYVFHVTHKMFQIFSSQSVPRVKISELRQINSFSCIHVDIALLAKLMGLLKNSSWLVTERVGWVLPRTQIVTL